MKLYICAIIVLLLANTVFPDSSAHYDLEGVQYMDRFIGSEKAKEMLVERGFVVTDQQFNQMFGAYIAHDYDRPAPAKFITVDSAWHTYHVLLEESVKQLEKDQAANLLAFSKKLHEKACELRKEPADVYADLARFAAVAMVMQDAALLDSIGQEDKVLISGIVERLKQGSGETRVLFFGTPIFAEYFRASSFYTADEVLRGYFSARQWYAGCNFKAGSRSETERAIMLALLIDGDAELKLLYQKLTAPYTKLLGPADDAGLQEYLALAREVVGGKLDAENIRLHVDELQKAAAGLPAPRVNDQYFPDRNSYQRWADDSKGFRLFGPRRLASAVVFQNAVDPAIEGRSTPSGLDFFAAGPLVCDAGKRALRADEQIRPFAEKIESLVPEPLPDSLHGEALNVLALLQEPLPDSAPAPLRSRAWEDKQLWTGLGAWAEQRHTWALHTKITAFYGGLTEEPPGYVSPYPDFFRELAELSRSTAAVFDSFGEAELDPVLVGKELVECVALMERTLIHEEALSEAEFVRIEQLDNFLAQYLEAIGREQVSPEEVPGVLKELETLGQRWLAGQVDQDNDERLMKAVLCSREDTTVLLKEFAELCDSLVMIADKELAEIALDEEDARLIEEYGMRLARFHFYEGNSWLEPRDDFPMVTPIFTNPARQEILYAGLSRPEALYIIIEFNGKPVLHRGAVLAYREFPRPMNAPLNDDGWKEEVWKGAVPPPPAFTASFREAVSNEEVLEIIKSGDIYRDIDRVPGHEITQMMIDLMLNHSSDYEHEYWLREHLCRRAGPEDVGSLIEILKTEKVGDEGQVAICIAYLPWKAHRDELMKLLHHKRIQYADSAAFIMSNRPEDINVKELLDRFSGQQPRTQRLYCYLLGHSKNEEAINLLMKCLLESRNAGVRYQAAEALGTAGINKPNIVSALIRALDDRNDCVAIQSAVSLYHLEAKEVASAILELLQSSESKDHYRGSRRSHRKEIFDNTSYSGYGSIMVLDDKDYNDKGYVSVKQLKEWAEVQLQDAVP
jgi:hypothetical protein